MASYCDGCIFHYPFNFPWNCELERYPDTCGSAKILGPVPERKNEMPGSSLEVALARSLNRLAKWRTVLAGWQLGSRSIEEGGAVTAVRDHLDVTMSLQVEIAALRRVFHVDAPITPEEKKENPQLELDGVRAHRVTTLRLRAEVNALLESLVQSGHITTEQFQQAMLAEIELAHKDLEEKFPGAKASDNGMVLTPEFQQTVARYRFPP